MLDAELHVGNRVFLVELRKGETSLGDQTKLQELGARLAHCLRSSFHSRYQDLAATIKFKTPNIEHVFSHKIRCALLLQEHGLLLDASEQLLDLQVSATCIAMHHSDLFYCFTCCALRILYRDCPALNMVGMVGRSLQELSPCRP